MFNEIFGEQPKTTRETRVLHESLPVPILGLALR